MKSHRTKIGDPADTWVETYETEEGDFTTLVSRVVGGERVRIEHHSDPAFGQAMTRHDTAVDSLRASNRNSLIP